MKMSSIGTSTGSSCGRNSCKECVFAPMFNEHHKQTDNRLLSLETRVHSIEKNMATKDDLKQVVSDLQPVRDKASKYDFIISLTKTYRFWIFVIIGIACVALAGQRIMDILKIVPLNP